MTLFEISDEQKALQALMVEGIDENGELLPESAQALEQWFAELQHNEAEKLDGYYGIIRTLEIQSAAAKEESERFAMMAKIADNASIRLKNRVKFYLESNGRTEAVSFKGRKFSVANNGGVQPLDIDPTVDPSKVAPEFQIVKVLLNNDRIREALQEGADVPFARLRPRGTHIRIHQPKGKRS